MKKPSKTIEIILVETDRANKISSEVIVETPVSLTINGQIWLTFMCTPVDVTAMALGFLYNEGLIDSMDAIADYRLCPTGDNVDIWTNHPLEKPDTWRKTSGCTGGVTAVEVNNNGTGGSSLLENTPLTISSDQVGRLVGLLFSTQDLYQKAGGVHTTLLCDLDQVVVATEDIGRHNTLDKIAGRCLMDGISIRYPILLTTGRISSEMLQKASRIGASIVISRTSPSSLSIELAEKRGITLIGYARRDRFRIYSHPERISTKIAHIATAKS